MRYMRQEKLIGKKNQELLSKKTVSIIGLGALGSVSAELLARAGIKKLVLIDRDNIELHNLQRQSLYIEEDVGKSKAVVIKEKLNKINKDIEIVSYFDNLDNENINLIKSDLILDCTDNLESRFLINEFSIKNKIPFIYASAIGTEGYLFNIVQNNACFNCIFKEIQGLETCETFGVLNSTTHLISSLQVNEAIKILLNQEYEKNLLYFNLKNNELIKIRINKSKDCSVCSKKIFGYLEGKKSKEIVKFCGSSSYLIKGKFDFDKVSNRLKKENLPITLFKNKVLIKAKDEKEAKSLFSKYIGD
ncbi:HesA/MoeB/ThiF family protein [Candidatus Woesearchaeota archaeon]|nr:HesA/MoeB/ThiF family protein [Candidatus Woesearchaeota archaeon]